MAAFRRFAPRLSTSDVASIAEEAVMFHWTDVFDHLVVIGIVKKLDSDRLSDIAGDALLLQRPDTLGMLMDSFDVNHSPASEMSLLEWAVQNDREDLTRLLLSKGASPETMSSGGNLLHRVHDAGVCQALIEAGADIENRNPEGDTPLLSAAKAAASRAVACLIDHGADVLVRDSQGRDVVGIAAGNGDHRTIAVLWSGGLLPNGPRTSGSRGRSALNR